MFRRGLAYLHREIDWTAIIGSALVLVFCLIVLLPALRASAAENAPQKANEQAAAHTEDDGIPQEFVSESLWVRTTSDPVALYTFVLAVFTAVLSVSTIGLWVKTDRLAKGAEESSERQLRAYISIKKARIKNVITGMKPQITLRIRNSGQTPAYDLTGHFSPGFYPYPVAESFLAEHPTASEISKSTIGPGQDLDCTAEFGSDFTENHVQALRAGQYAIYFVGIIEFVDAFNKSRFKHVRLMYRKEGFLTGSNRLDVCPNGNEEN